MNTQRVKDRRAAATVGTRRADGHRAHDERVKAERMREYERRVAQGRPLFPEPRR